MKHVVLILALAFSVLVGAADAQNCPGPDNTSWSSTQNACAGGQNTSCDSVNQTTCFYAYLINRETLGGTFGKNGIFTVAKTGGINGLQAGDQLRALGRAGAKRLTNLRSGNLLTRYDAEHRARSLRLRIYRPKTRRWQTVTWKG